MSVSENLGRKKDNVLEGVSLRRLEILSLLPLVDRLPLPLPLLTLKRFRDPSLLASSSFFGGMFSFPLPNLRPPRSPYPSSPPFPARPLPPPAATDAFKFAGEGMEGEDCVRSSIPPPPPPPPPPRVIGPGTVKDGEEPRSEVPLLPLPLPLPEALALARRAGVKSELLRVRGV